MGSRGKAPVGVQGAKPPEALRVAAFQRPVVGLNCGQVCHCNTVEEQSSSEDPGEKIMVVDKGTASLRFKVFRGMLWFNIEVRYVIVESYQKVNLKHHGWLRHGRRYRWRHVPQQFKWVYNYVNARNTPHQ